MNDKAFILGNGPDRPTDIKWLNNLEGDTYGCNAIYRDFEPDFLVANDWAMMVEIINSTYAGNCQFTDFEELPMEALEGIKYMPEYETAIHIGEQKTLVHLFLWEVQHLDYHIIWLDESLTTYSRGV